MDFGDEEEDDEKVKISFSVFYLFDYFEKSVIYPPPLPVQSVLRGLIPASQHLQAVSAHHGNQKLFELNEDLTNLFHMSPHIHMLIEGASRRFVSPLEKHPQLKTPCRRINTEQMTAR